MADQTESDDYRGYNPFCAVNILHDRLFIEYDKTDMTPYLNRRGMVFVDGKPLTQVALYNQMSLIPGSYWVEANGQTVHFRLEDDGDPADHVIELSCREQCFAPDIPFLNYIKVSGLICAHASMERPSRSAARSPASAGIIGLLRTVQLIGQMPLVSTVAVSVGTVRMRPDASTDIRLFVEIRFMTLVSVALRVCMRLTC